MKDLTAKFLYAIASIMLVALLVCGIMAYMVNVYDQDTGQLYDGLGRPLEVTPILAHLILGEDSLWAGWLWFGIDFVLFWGTAGLAYALFSLGKSIQKKCRDDGKTRHKNV